MKYINLGCGWHFSNRPEWTNLDFEATGEGVIVHNLLKGIPYPDQFFDLVYHSHVLEHFSKDDGEKFMDECFRILKPGGILRVAVPDLETICRNYLQFLEAGWKEPENELIRANYDWMLLEMYDQVVRNAKGGNIGKYFLRPVIRNEDFVFQRIGEESRAFRNMILGLQYKKTSNPTPVIDRLNPIDAIRAIRNKLKRMLFRICRIDIQALEIGKFRLTGEVHQWMFDKYSMTNLLKAMGGDKIEIRNANTSYIRNWTEYGLDTVGDKIKKPDSLFIEAIKK
jgi:predicted SAM-dependent methyltransferase